MLALMDTGSEVNLISAEVMTNNPGWAKHRRTCNVKLNFGNASKGVEQRSGPPYSAVRVQCLYYSVDSGVSPESSTIPI